MLLKYFPLPSSYRAEINIQGNKFSQEFSFLISMENSQLLYEMCLFSVQAGMFLTPIH